MKTLTMKLLALTFIASMIGLAGCATAPQQRPIADLVDQIKSGMTKEQVVTAAGEPKSRSVSNDGGEVWQYRQTAKAYQGQKKALDILSFGMGTMAEAEMQDILNVTFTNSIVAKINYQENVNMATMLQNR